MNTEDRDLIIRPRRLRRTKTMRRLVRETQLHTDDFIAPVFIINGENKKNAIPSMPEIYQWSIDRVNEEIDELLACGIDKIVLFVGRIEPLKGIDTLLKAMPSLHNSTKLLVVGGDEKDSDRIDSLRVLADSLGVGDQVSFLDARPHDKMPLFYNSANVCVIPSYYESFGLVALEAMACGVPVIASDVGGLRETIYSGRTGYLVPYHDPGRFAEYINLVLNDDALASELGDMARSDVWRFGWEEVAERIEHIYHNLVWSSRSEALASHVSRPQW